MRQDAEVIMKLTDADNAADGIFFPALEQNMMGAVLILSLIHISIMLFFNKNTLFTQYLAINNIRILLFKTESFALAYFVDKLSYHALHLFNDLRIGGGKVIFLL